MVAVMPRSRMSLRMTRVRERGTIEQNAKGAFQWTFNVMPKGPTGKVLKRELARRSRESKK